MKATELIKNYYANNPKGHFFDKSTLEFFGERTSEMYVRENTRNIHGHECYVLLSTQHNHPMGSKRIEHYFDVNTFKQIFI